MANKFRFVPVTRDDYPMLRHWLADRPCAYVQDCLVHHWNMPHLRQRANELLEVGFPAVIIDPSPDNTSAVRAYRAAGFTGDRVRRPYEDGDRVLVMEFTGGEAPETKCKT